MFKKALQIALTIAALIGAHLGYTKGFELVTARLTASGDGDDSPPFPPSAAATWSIRATELAREQLGPDHWAAEPIRPISYYDRERGFYMYAKSYERRKKGQQLILRPFALISASRDGKGHKVVTADEAVVDLSQPFLSMKAAPGPMRIVHAQMAGNVVIRDDKGTADRPEDDLVVGPLTHIDYDEKQSNITSDSNVVLRDRDLTATGKGLLIRLRKAVGSGGASGFEAEAAYLNRNVHLMVRNVGSNGVLPGKSKEDGTGQTPLDLRCDGQMEILLPPSRPVVAIGPPHLDRPPDPTFARFFVKVVVLRGTHTPDQLNCDELLLTLMPTPKVARPAAKTADEIRIGVAGKGDQPPTPAPTGPLTELKLREALATGHAVWIQSESQGLKARCIELKYKKSADGSTPDETYLNGGAPPRKLYAEKTERVTSGPNIGAIRSVLRLYTMDATIFDDGQGGASTVVARGPGKAEERKAPNASVDRTAWWEDQLILRTEAGPVAPGTSPVGPDGKPAKGSLRRELTLTGVSKLVDDTRQTTLDARTKIIARFKSASKASPGGRDDSTKIESMTALDDVHLTAPNRTMTARHLLETVFEDDAPGGLIVQAPAGPPSVPGPAIPIAANPSLASARVAAPSAPVDGDGSQRPTPAPAPVEPNVDVRANRVWARILHRGGEGKDEFREAKLRGEVMVHQDPAPGKVRGLDASGEALDLMNQGDGLMKCRVVDTDPSAVAARARLAASGRPPAAPVMARVETEEMTIEGPDIGLDQRANYAEVRGPGKLTEWTERGLLDDRGLDAPRPRPDVAVPVGTTKARLVITWTDEMKFHGMTTDPQGRPSAKAEFRGRTAEVRTADGRSTFVSGVTATMEDAKILCEAMDVFTDKPVAMNRDARPKEKKDPTAPAEPAAQIAFMDCRGRDRRTIDDRPFPGVDIISQKVYPGTRDVREKNRIWGEHVTYDKRTGDFTAPGHGTVFLYKRKNGAKDKDPATPVAIPIVGPGRDGTGGVASPIRGALPPMELTKVAFRDGMQGRFGVGKDKVDSEDRVAEFYGGAQAINAIVKDTAEGKASNKDLDFDHQPLDVMFLTSEYLRVVSHPLGEGKSAQQLLYARGNAQARTFDRTIQGDRITYDSMHENAYVYGDAGKEVVLIDQRNIGQPSSTLRGKSGRYNKRTREASIEDPQTINFADLKSGIRPKPNSPDTGGSPRPPDPLKQQRVLMPRVPRMNVERGTNAGR